MSTKKSQKIVAYDENEIAINAQNAFTQASLETLRLGYSVVRVIDNQICRVYPDGYSERLKDIQASNKVDKNRKYKLSLKK